VSTGDDLKGVCFFVAGADAADAERLIIGGELANWAESVDQVCVCVCVCVLCAREPPH
jgi:hypothetical protein